MVFFRNEMERWISSVSTLMCWVLGTSFPIFKNLSAYIVVRMTYRSPIQNDPTICFLHWLTSMKHSLVINIISQHMLQTWKKDKRTRALQFSTVNSWILRPGSTGFRRAPPVTPTLFRRGAWRRWLFLQKKIGGPAQYRTVSYNIIEIWASNFIMIKQGRNPK